MNNTKNSWSGETVISVKKIWQNIKQFWWVILIFVALFSLVLVRDMRNTYVADQEIASRDTYQSSVLLYYPHRDNEQGLAFVVLCESEMVTSSVNAQLKENGFVPYGVGDTFSVDWIGNSFGISLVGEGKERMLLMAQLFGEAILASAYEVTGNVGSVLTKAWVTPCLVKSSGAVVALEDASQRQASFSLKEFLNWKRLMVIGAAFFMGFAVIFVAILLDKKVRTREELDAVLVLPCIGVIKKKKKDFWHVTVDLLANICAKRQFRKVALISVKTFTEGSDLKKDLEQRMQVVSSLGQCAVEEGITIDGSAFAACKDADGLVLMVSANRDHLDQVVYAVKNMNLLEKDWIGYILFE